MPVTNESSSVIDVYVDNYFPYVKVKSRVKLEGEELERYLEKEKEKEKNKPTSDAVDRR